MFLFVVESIIGVYICMYIIVDDIVDDFDVFVVIMDNGQVVSCCDLGIFSGHCLLENYCFESGKNLFLSFLLSFVFLIAYSLTLIATICN